MVDTAGESFRTWISRLAIIIGIILIGFGIFRYFNITVTWDEPWQLFQPAYTIIFGIILLLSEFDVKLVTENLRFLSNYFGRGVYVIYLSTIVTGNLTGGDVFRIVSIVVAVILLVTGLFYFFIFCCCSPPKEEEGLDSEKLKKPLKKDSGDKEEEKLTRSSKVKYDSGCEIKQKGDLIINKKLLFPEPLPQKN